MKSIEHLVGLDIYLDTSQTPTSRDLDTGLVKKIIAGHGPERILYASDYPWARQGPDIGWEYDWIRGLGTVGQRYRQHSGRQCGRAIRSVLNL